MITKSELKNYIMSLKNKIFLEVRNADENYDLVEDALYCRYADNMRYESNDACVAIDVKNRGWPNIDDVSIILSTRLNIEVGKIYEILDDINGIVDDEGLTTIFWDEVGIIIKSISNDIGIDVYQYGRSDGYWGFQIEPADRLDCKWTYGNALNYELSHVLDYYLDELYESFIDNIEPPNNINDIDEDNLILAIKDKIWDNMEEDGLGNIIESGIINKFILLVEDIVKLYKNQETWADICEFFVTDTLKYKRKEFYLNENMFEL